jgi:ribosomal protein L7/L12
MSLIKCPECASEVSEKAASCPKCGFPLQAAAPSPSADLDAVIKQTLTGQGKIAAIKLYRECNPNAGLAEAKEYIERLEASLPPGTGAKSTKGCMSILLLGGLIIAGLILVAVWA